MHIFMGKDLESKTKKTTQTNCGGPGFAKKPNPPKTLNKVVSSCTADFDSDFSDVINNLGTRISASSKKIKKKKKKLKNTLEINKQQQQNYQKTKSYKRHEGMNQQNRQENNGCNIEKGYPKCIQDGNGNSLRDYNDGSYEQDSNSSQQEQNHPQPKKSRKNSVKQMSNFLRKIGMDFGYQKQIAKLQKDEQNKNKKGEGKNYRGSRKYYVALLIILKHKKPTKYINEYNFKKIIRQHILDLDRQKQLKQKDKQDFERKLEKQDDPIRIQEIRKNIQELTNLIKQYPIAKSSALILLNEDEVGCIEDFFRLKKQKTYLKETFIYCLRWKQELQKIKFKIQIKNLKLEDLKFLMKNFQQDNLEFLLQKFQKKDEDKYLDELLNL